MFPSSQRDVNQQECFCFECLTQVAPKQQITLDFYLDIEKSDFKSYFKPVLSTPNVASSSVNPSNSSCSISPLREKDVNFR